MHMHMHVMHMHSPGAGGLVKEVVSVEDGGGDFVFFPLIPNESRRLPKELNSAISEDPKSSSPKPFSLPLVEAIRGSKGEEEVVEEVGVARWVERLVGETVAAAGNGGLEIRVYKIPWISGEGTSEITEVKDRRLSICRDERGPSS